MLFLVDDKTLKVVYNLGAYENVKAGKEFADMNLRDFDIMTESAPA